MLANGTWSGITALVIGGKTDVGVSAFGVTKERCKVVDTTYSLGSYR
jgi:hypothetical protein